jgi:hypothetical protein
MKKITRLFLLIVAIVASGNVAKAQNNDCAGWLTETTAGTLTLGYNYWFSTSGTSVIVTIELLDNVSGLAVPTANGSAMTLVSGKKYTKTFTGQTIGAVFNVQCNFVWASGGLANTKIFAYTVGSDCGTSTDTEAPTAFTATAGTGGCSSVGLLLNATDNNGGMITYTISYGTGPTVVTTDCVSGISKLCAVSGFTDITATNFSVTAKDAKGNTTSPVIVSVAPGFIGTSSPAVVSGYSVANLFDGTNTTGWKVATILTSYLTFTYSNPQVFNKVILTAFTSASRYPTAWKIEGGNDTISNGWTILDTQTAQTFGANEVRPYSFTNATAYTYYRLHITAGFASSTYLGELAFSNVSVATDLKAISQNTIDGLRIFTQNSKLVADLSDVKGASIVSVFDSKGSILNTVKSRGGEILNINLQNKGFYLVRIQNGDKDFTQKVVY